MFCCIQIQDVSHFTSEILSCQKKTTTHLEYVDTRCLCNMYTSMVVWFKLQKTRVWSYSGSLNFTAFKFFAKSEQYLKWKSQWFEGSSFTCLVLSWFTWQNSNSCSVFKLYSDCPWTGNIMGSSAISNSISNSITAPNNLQDWRNRGKIEVTEWLVYNYI